MMDDGFDGLLGRDNDNCGLEALDRYRYHECKMQ
jgi:hypothetical protein